MMMRLLSVTCPEVHVVANPAAIAKRDPHRIGEGGERREPHSSSAGQQAALRNLRSAVPVRDSEEPT
jgi:hypothetical protein